MSGTFTELILLNSIIHPEVGITIPITQMIEFRLRGFKYLTQGHSVLRRRSQKFILTFLPPSSVLSLLGLHIDYEGPKHTFMFLLFLYCTEHAVYTINTCMELGPNCIKMVCMIYFFIGLYLTVLFRIFTCT